MHYTESPRINQEQTNHCHDFKLTGRERECLEHLVFGMTAKEIGRKLDISHRTVEIYINNIKRKMGCFNKSQLVTKILSNYAHVELLL